MLGDILFVLVILGIIIGLILSIILMVYLIDKNVYTPNFGEETEKPVKYNFWAGGCFVQLDSNQWIHCSDYKGINIEN